MPEGPRGLIQGAGALLPQKHVVTAKRKISNSTSSLAFEDSYLMIWLGWPRVDAAHHKQVKAGNRFLHWLGAWPLSTTPGVIYGWSASSPQIGSHPEDNHLTQRCPRAP